MWSSFWMSLAPVVDILDSCISRAVKLSNWLFIFLFSRLVLQCLNCREPVCEWWMEESDTQRLCDLLKFSLHLPFFFFFFCPCCLLLLSHCYQRGVTLLTGHEQVYLFLCHEVFVYLHCSLVPHSVNFVLRPAAQCLFLAKLALGQRAFRCLQKKQLHLSALKVEWPWRGR